MDTQERIIKVADELFRRYGVKSVTMDNIAKQMGISKKTIYQYYKDKSKLVTEVFSASIAEQRKDMDRIIAEAIDPVDEVLRISEYIIKVMLQNMHSSVLFEVQKYYPKAFQVFLDHRQDYIFKCLTTNLEKGIEQGLYRKDISVEILSILRLEQIVMGFNPFLFSPVKFNISEIQMQFVEHFLFGVCTLKGHKLINKYKKINEDE